MPPNHRRRGALGGLAAATSILLALGTPASADINPGGTNENGQYVATPTQQNSDALSPTMKKAEGDVLVFVKFKGQGAYEQYDARCSPARRCRENPFSCRAG